MSARRLDRGGDAPARLPLPPRPHNFAAFLPIRTAPLRNRGPRGGCGRTLRVTLREPACPESCPEPRDAPDGPCRALGRHGGAGAAGLGARGRAEAPGRDSRPTAPAAQPPPPRRPRRSLSRTRAAPGAGGPAASSARGPDPSACGPAQAPAARPRRNQAPRRRGDPARHPGHGARHPGLRRRPRQAGAQRRRRGYGPDHRHHRRQGRPPPRGDHRFRRLPRRRLAQDRRRLARPALLGRQQARRAVLQLNRNQVRVSPEYKPATRSWCSARRPGPAPATASPPPPLRPRRRSRRPPRLRCRPHRPRRPPRRDQAASRTPPTNDATAPGPAPPPRPSRPRPAAAREMRRIPARIRPATRCGSGPAARRGGGARAGALARQHPRPRRLHVLRRPPADGFGPFVAVYFTSQSWTQSDIGLVLTIGGLFSLFGQVPAAPSSTG